MADNEILLGEDFDRPIGEYSNFGAIPVAQEDQLALQKHTDIRCMNQADTQTQINMLYLDLLVMQDLDSMTMNQLNGDVTIKRGEQWSDGSFGAQADRNNWPGMSLSCLVGTNITQSVMVTS